MPYSLLELSKKFDLELKGSPSHQIDGVEDIVLAQHNQITFLDNEKYTSALKTTNAGAIIISKNAFPKYEHINKNFLLSPNYPSLYFQKVIELFLPHETTSFKGHHPSAVIDDSAIIGNNVIIEPNAVICAHVHIGDNSYIGANSYIGIHSKIGNNCLIYPNVVVREFCEIHNRVILQSGSVIGSCGFGYVSDHQGKHHHLKHLGKVILEDDVEIGANTTVDRARFKATIIQEGSKIDNQVQIAHQVEVGKHSIIVAQAGIAGSTKIGNHVIIGGQTGIAGHVTITDHVMMMAQTGVSKSIKTPGIYGGAPARPYQETHKIIAKIKNLPKMDSKLTSIEKKLESLLEQNQKEEEISK